MALLSRPAMFHILVRHDGTSQLVGRALGLRERSHVAVEHGDIVGIRALRLNEADQGR